MRAIPTIQMPVGMGNLALQDGSLAEAIS